MVATDKIVAIISPDGASIKRLIQYSKENHLFVDATTGRKTRSVIITTDGFLFLSAIQADTLVSRLNDIV